MFWPGDQPIDAAYQKNEIISSHQPNPTPAIKDDNTDHTSGSHPVASSPNW
ncbi:hypothetical protein BH09BAC4_BH09BAC4_06140 [soil metagenome]